MRSWRWVFRILGLATLAVVALQLMQFQKNMQALEVETKFIHNRLPIYQELTAIMAEFRQIATIARQDSNKGNDVAVASQLSELANRYAMKIEELTLLDVPSDALHVEELEEFHLNAIEAYQVCRLYQEHMTEYFANGRPQERLELAQEAYEKCIHMFEELNP